MKLPRSPRYGTPAWHAAVAAERARIEALFAKRGHDGTGRETYGRGRFEGAL